VTILGDRTEGAEEKEENCPKGKAKTPAEIRTENGLQG
jgi:hypothetical protein